MRRAVTFAAAWIVAAGVAVGAAWQGVGIVTRQVTDDRPAALAADEVRDLAQVAGTTTSAAPAPGPTAVAPTTSAAPSTTITAPPAPTITVTTAAPPVASAPSETRTYNVVGGSVALRFTPDGVTVVWATPDSGFAVDVEPQNGNGVRVEFESDQHRSRVEGWWDGGPRERVREEPR